MNLENIGKDCPCYEVDCSDIMFDIGEFCGLPPNNGKLTIQVNGSTVGDFSANQQEDETINITTPTSQDIADAVAGEALLRQQADNTLQANIDAIASKSDVVDVVGTYAELQAYDTSKLDDNDVVKVLDDSTHNDSMTYYRWNETTQTWSYIGQESPYYSKSQTDALLAQKQDNLTAGTGITLNGSTISADTTVLAEKSELDNYAEKANTYTKTEVDNLVEPKLSVEVVEQLEVQGEKNKLYLTPKAHTTQTATGNPIAATVTDDAGQIEDFQLDGDTYQQSYSGKNLLQLIESSRTISGVTLTLNSDGTFGLAGTATADVEFSRTVSLAGSGIVGGQSYTISSDAPIETYGTSYYVHSVNSAGQWNKTLLGFRSAGTQTAATPSTDYIKFVVRVGNGATVNYPSIKTMIEAGSTASDYEPYVGGQASPNPDYPQPIQTVTGEQIVEVRGKNLFDKATITTGAYLTTDGGIVPTIDYDTTDYIAISPSTTYYLPKTSTRRLKYYNADKVALTNDWDIASGATGQAITTPSGAYYVRFSFDNRVTDINTFQFELGSTPTTYAPYSHQTLPISLGSIELCKLGTYQDYIWKDGDTWKVHKATKKLILDGSEEWLYYNGVCQLNSITDYATSNNTPYCGAFSGSSNVAGLSAVPENCCCFIRVSGETTPRFYVRYESKFSSVDAISQYLTTNPTSLYYSIATPTDTAITDTTLISQLNAIASASLENGSNTITNTATGSNLAGDMEVDYFGYDPTNRYDKWLWLDINNAYEKLGS